MKIRKLFFQLDGGSVAFGRISDGQNQSGNSGSSEMLGTFVTESCMITMSTCLRKFRKRRTSVGARDTSHPATQVDFRSVKIRRQEMSVKKVKHDGGNLGWNAE